MIRRHQWMSSAARGGQNDPKTKKPLDMDVDRLNRFHNKTNGLRSKALKSRWLEEFIRTVLLHFEDGVLLSARRRNTSTLRTTNNPSGASKVCQLTTDTGMRGLQWVNQGHWLAHGRGCLPLFTLSFPPHGGLMLPLFLPSRDGSWFFRVIATAQPFSPPFFMCPCDQVTSHSLIHPPAIHRLSCNVLKVCRVKTQMTRGKWWKLFSTRKTQLMLIAALTSEMDKCHIWLAKWVDLMVWSFHGKSLAQGHWSSCGYKRMRVCVACRRWSFLTINHSYQWIKDRQLTALITRTDCSTFSNFLFKFTLSSGLLNCYSLTKFLLYLLHTGQSTICCQQNLHPIDSLDDTNSLGN